MSKYVLMFLLVISIIPVASRGQSMPFGSRPITSGGGAPTITVTSAVCNGTANAASTSCTLGASAAVGDLLIIKSKSAALTLTETVVFSFSGTASCTPTSVLAETQQPNGSGTFTVAIAGCIVTAAGASIPVATWTGTSPFFSDIEAFTVHTTNTWKTTFVDQVASNPSATSSTSCGTGTTSATTTANDFILATCDNFNVGETWGTLTGFTSYVAAERSTAATYYKSVTSTGTQTATVPLSAADFGLGVIVAFASN